MEREIRFRAKSLENGQLIIGDLMFHKPFLEEIAYIKQSRTHQIIWEKVDEKTIGQCTGQRDRNDKEIYEGDIIYRSNAGTTGQVVFERGRFVIKWRPIAGYVMFDSKMDTCSSDEIKGNIYQHPELLK